MTNYFVCLKKVIFEYITNIISSHRMQIVNYIFYLLRKLNSFHFLYLYIFIRILLFSFIKILFFHFILSYCSCFETRLEARENKTLVGSSFWKLFSFSPPEQYCHQYFSVTLGTERKQKPCCCGILQIVCYIRNARTTLHTYVTM